MSKRLITRCDWFKDVVLLGLFQPMRSLNPKWTNYLINVGNGNHGEYENWSGLAKEFGIKITCNFEEATEFYIKDADLANDFPLDM